MVVRYSALEGLVMNREFWAGRRVFLTGHTGFKGGWLAMWLSDMGAEVYGYALPAEHDDGVYALGLVADCLSGETLADIRNSAQLEAALVAARPEIVLHLAAQPLVRASYRDPLETFSVNVSGLLCLLDCIRKTEGVLSVVNVTSDKCYENREWLWPYRETEALGGHDPYSASKACAEIVTASYKRSFMEQAGIGLASARAGNVIGGGDRSEDRLVPDFLRALDAGEPTVLRNPKATRPWQHVLEPLAGYLALAESLFNKPALFSEAWNFGPEHRDIREVGEIVTLLSALAKTPKWELAGGASPHEAQSLSLDSSKAKSRLGWVPKWSIETALARTLEWHMAWRDGDDMRRRTLGQIQEYEAA